MKRILGGLLVFINGENADDICNDLSRHYSSELNYKVTVIHSNVDIDCIIDSLVIRLACGHMLLLSDMQYNMTKAKIIDKCLECGLFMDDEGWTTSINIRKKEEGDAESIFNILSHTISNYALENCIDIIDELLLRSYIVNNDDEINTEAYHIVRSGEYVKQ